jgi:predicted secreted protein
MARVLATLADNGGVVLARAGDDIVLELPESPGTGFLWEPRS